MAITSVIAAFLLFPFALSLNFDLSTSQLVHGKVTCVDCSSHFDFSGIKILIKCDGDEKSATATTRENGSFQVKLPHDKTSNSPFNCLAKILGGPEQLYASKPDMVSKIINSPNEPNSFTILTPLSFSLSRKDDGAANSVGSSKTFDLPVPGGLGLAPASYYFPVLPIIGIP